MEGQRLYEFSSPRFPLCNAVGDKIFLGQFNSGSPIAILIGDTVYAGFGGKTPLFKIDGKRIYDGFGYGAPILTADAEDPMALAAAAVMCRTNADLRGYQGGLQDDCQYSSDVFGEEAEVLFGKPVPKEELLTQNVPAPERPEIPAEILTPDVYDGLGDLDRKVVNMYPWFYAACRNETRAEDLPLMKWANLHPDDTRETVLHRHRTIGANYSDVGIVKSKWQMEMEYIPFMKLKPHDWYMYYIQVPYYFTHDEWMFGDGQDYQRMKDLVVQREQEEKAAQAAKELSDEEHRRIALTKDFMHEVTLKSGSLTALCVIAAYLNYWLAGGFLAGIVLFFPTFFVLMALHHIWEQRLIDCDKFESIYLYERMVPKLKTKLSKYGKELWYIHYDDLSGFSGNCLLLIFFCIVAMKFGDANMLPTMLLIGLLMTIRCKFPMLLVRIGFWFAPRNFSTGRWFRGNRMFFYGKTMPST
jgi:hypothetical protein